MTPTSKCPPLRANGVSTGIAFACLVAARAFRRSSSHLKNFVIAACVSRHLQTGATKGEQLLVTITAASRSHIRIALTLIRSEEANAGAQGWDQNAHSSAGGRRLFLQKPLPGFNAVNTTNAGSRKSSKEVPLLVRSWSRNCTETSATNEQSPP